MKKTIFLSVVALALGVGSLSAGTIALTITGQAGGDVTAALPWTTGWAFTTSQAFNVVSLGYYDSNPSGLLSAHDVGIYNSGGTLLVSATVPIGTGGTVSGAYRMVAITAYTLAAGSYVIGGYNNNSSLDPFNINSTSATPISGLTIGNKAVWLPGSGLTFPTNSAPGVAYYNPMFEVAPAASGVPEPATAGLVLAAFAAFALRKRFHA